MTEGNVDGPRPAPDDAGVRPPPSPGAYEPPRRDARGRVVGAWARSGPAMRAVLVAAVMVTAALLGAFPFGLWHMVIGGFLKGNRNAGGFGFALASVAGVLLWIEASIARRLLR